MAVASPNYYTDILMIQTLYLRYKENPSQILKELNSTSYHKVYSSTIENNFGNILNTDYGVRAS